MTFGELLYSSDGNTLQKPFEGLSVNIRGISGQGLSEARASASTVNDDKAKISNALWFANEYCVHADSVTSKFGVLELTTSEKIYVEFQTEGVLYKALFDPSIPRVTWSEIPDAKKIKLIPVAIYCITKGRYASADFKTLMESARSVTEDELKTNAFRFCDSVYYEFSDTFREIEEAGSLMDAVIKQAYNTNSTQRSEVFEPYCGDYVFSFEDSSSSSASEEKDDNDAVFTNCMLGEYVLEHVWEIERETFIPSLEYLENFIPVPQFFSMVKLISRQIEKVLERMMEGKFGLNAIQNNYINFQIVGRPATGKTKIANALAATFGMPIRIVTNSKNCEEDVFQGMTKMVDGNFGFVETPFLDIYKNGGIIVLEEYNLTDSGVMMGALGQAIEKPFILLEDGYKEIRRHPLCIIIATANVGTQGTRDPSEAFSSRLPHTFILNDPSDKDFIDILQKNCENVKKQDCKKVYKAYKKVLNYLLNPDVNAEDIALSITLRSCIAALMEIECGIGFKEAVKNTIIGAVGIKDMELEQNLERIILPTI